MKIKVKNLGVLKQAEFSLGDMTILCGENNTGKTYATYALFGFLSFWRQAISIEIKDEKINHLFSEGVVQINLVEYVKEAQHILSQGCKDYAEKLPFIFAAHKDRFKGSSFEINLDESDIKSVEEYEKKSYERRINSADIELFSITKNKESVDLIATLLIEKEKVKIPKDAVKQVIVDVLKDIIFGHLFSNPFIASAERTGTAIFRKELNFPRNRLLEEISQTDKNINPIFKDYQDYALPVKMNVNFTRQIEAIAKENSFITEHHPNLLDDFTDILGGKYTVTRNDELYYIPKGKKVRLSMDESSSAVRSLLDIGFYIKHIAKAGDLLMVDEPELNLHPENQRRIARLFARLINLGIRVFITTHSDYIIKELNTLIMLNHDKSHIQRIAQKEGYKKEELISADKIKVYIAEESLIKCDESQRKTRCQTLVLADIDPELGIEARSFDKTIEEMNRIQKEILWEKD